MLQDRLVIPRREAFPEGGREAFATKKNFEKASVREFLQKEQKRFRTSERKG